MEVPSDFSGLFALSNSRGIESHLGARHQHIDVCKKLAMLATNTMKRCSWCGNDPLYVAYHDEQWGVPVHDDRLLFEMLVLEGAQAGLSWLTILRKREHYRRAFDGFQVRKVAAYGATEVERLLADPGIVRNRLKIESAIRNARGVLAIQREFGSLDAYLWRFVDGSPRQNAWRSLAELPARTEQSDALSRDLKKRGFNFVGSTICYSFMQAVGMVNDHVVDCFRYAKSRSSPLQPPGQPGVADVDSPSGC